jgi:hypothetical protein
MKTSVIVRQTKYSCLQAATQSSQMTLSFAGQLDSPNRGKMREKTVIELINQINTWHRFEGA